MQFWIPLGYLPLAERVKLIHMANKQQLFQSEQQEGSELNEDENNKYI